MATFGFFCHATTGHYFYNFLDAQIPKVTPLTVALKVLIDQTMWAPLFMVMFFSYGCLFDGTPELIAKKCKNDIFTAVKGSWFTWVPAHTINFAFIPTEQRLLYINTVQIFFNIFMSVIRTWSIKRAARRRERDARSRTHARADARAAAADSRALSAPRQGGQTRRPPLLRHRDRPPPLPPGAATRPCWRAPGS